MGSQPPTGKSFSVPGASIIELQAGKIKRETLYWDSATFLRQLGLMPEVRSRQ
jgi:ketosteroid isomerase-like protein